MDRGYAVKTIPLVLLMFLSCGTATAQLSLKGDVLGEPLPTFKTNHPRATCEHFSDVVISCQEADASFAGHQPYIFYSKEGDCFSICGLVAEFYRGKLSFVAYNVSNRDGGSNVVQLLKQKFGKPKFLYSDDMLTSATWERGSTICGTSLQRMFLTWAGFPTPGLAKSEK